MRNLTAPAADTIARHALGWLVAANIVGVLLAALLLWPNTNSALAPLTYGRWMPLHIDWQLYGWCALPLVGALFAWMLPSGNARAATHARWAVRLWSLALAIGGVSWLSGGASGKLFLNWSGWTRPLLPVAMIALWCVLAVHTAGQRRNTSRGAWIFKVAVLSVLATVPAALYLASSPDLYPSVNPDSGGATGASLLGSTLGIVAIAGALPYLLGVPMAKPGGRRWTSTAFWLLFAGSVLVYAIVNHGHASHHAPAQIAALATLMLWAPLLCLHFRRFDWPSSARPWLRAGAVWWCVLIVTGWLTFLPEISERLKFTNALVAHAHLALAGLVTSVGAAILASLGRAPGGGAPAFWAWQLACAAHVTVLTALGSTEMTHAADFFTGAHWVSGLLGARLGTGVIMLAASIFWLRRGVRPARMIAVPAAGLLLAMAPAASHAAEVEDPLIAAGRRVYISEGCIHCHSQFVRPRIETEVTWWGPANTPAKRSPEAPPLLGNRRQGPDLSAVGNRRSPEWQRLHLIDPRAVVPGSRMPAYAHLFSGDAARGDALLAYLASLGRETLAERLAQNAHWTPPAAALSQPDLRRGAALFASLCSSCHGATGHGDGRLTSKLMLRPPAFDRDPWRRLAPTEPEPLVALARIVKFGLPGTAMAGHEYLSDADTVGLAAFVKSLHKDTSSNL